MDYINPYADENFFGFLITLFLRTIDFIFGSLSFNDLVSDEVQVLVLLGISISSALVGTFLVLRKMTMLANSLSHTILLGIVIAYLLTKGLQAESSGHFINIKAMLFASLIMGIITTFMTEILCSKFKLQEDASIGIVFTSLFALGIILLTLLTRSAHIGTEVIFGNVDALQLDDISLVFTILAINLLLFLAFFKEYKITTFDPNLAAALGFFPLFFNYLLMIQVSATSIGAFRAVGVILVLAFMTGPALTARLLTNDLKKMLLLAILIGAIASITGVALSRHLLSQLDVALSTGGIVVCVIFVIFIFGLIYNKLRLQKLAKI